MPFDHVYFLFRKKSIQFRYHLKFFFFFVFDIKLYELFIYVAY